ncbi:MAG TPA: hypothetical protein VGQ00_03810 [Candidatus Norongarragalinales archaeon]|jgi:HEAT repeat protein|nr:hypothetical protein [Candidatus Norongarragalinales archaeon]
MSKLERFLKTGHPDQVIGHLRRMRDPKRIATALEHEKIFPRSAAAARLTEIDPAGFRAYFLREIQRSEDFRRRKILHIIANMGPRNAEFTDDIAELGLKHKVADTRNYALLALGKIGPPAAKYIPEIANRGLYGPTLTEAVKALERIGDPAAIPFLKKEIEKDQEPLNFRKKHLPEWEIKEMIFVMRKLMIMKAVGRVKKFFRFRTSY